MSKKIEHKTINGIECKRCCHCKEYLLLNCFDKCKINWDGLQKNCKSCRKQYRIKHVEKIKQYKKQYYIEHAEKVKRHSKQYYIEHTEEAKQHRKQYNNQLAFYGVYIDQVCWCEEVRQDGKFLEVKCAYCGRWLKPTNKQVQIRVSAINGKMSGENRFYCSENCKKSCPIFGQRKYPKGFKQATSREVVPLLRQIVLKRDNYICQKCGATTETAQLHVHHIITYAQNKMQANDPDSCITLCKSCHEKIHKQEGCDYNDLKCKKETHSGKAN